MADLTLTVHSSLSGDDAAPKVVHNETVSFPQLAEPTPEDRVEIRYGRPMNFTPVPYHSCGARVEIVLSTTKADLESGMDAAIEWVESKLQIAAQRALDNHREWCRQMGVPIR